METIVALIPVTAGALLATVYAHLALASQSRSPATALVTRIVLLATAFGFGGVTAVWYGRSLPMQLLLGLTSFGIVHVPPACILFLKRLRARQETEAP